MAREKSIKLNMVLNMIRTLMGVIYPLISFPYVSRILNPEGIGKVDFSVSTVSLFGILAGLGINTYAMREGAKIRENKEKFSTFVTQMFTINLASTFLSLILFIVCIFVIPKYAQYQTLLIVCVFTMVFSPFSLEYVFSANEDFVYITLRTIIIQVLSLICIFIFVRESDDYLPYCLISVVGNVLTCVLNFFNAKKYFNFKKSSLKSLYPHCKPIFLLFAVSVASSVYSILDQNMLGLLATDYDVGIYNASIKVIRIVIPFLAAMTATLVPRLSFLYEQDREQYYIMLRKSINLLSLLAVPSVVGLFVLARPIILVLCGNEFNDSIYIMQLMTPIIFFILCGGILGDQIFLPMRKDKLNLYPVIGGACINLTLNLILIPRYGAFGAGIGTLAAESSVNILKFIFAVPYTKGKGYFSDLWKYFTAAVIMGLGVYIISVLIKSNVLQLLIGIPFGALIYAIVLLLLKSEFAEFMLDFIVKKIKVK